MTIPTDPTWLVWRRWLRDQIYSNGRRTVGAFRDWWELNFDATLTIVPADAPDDWYVCPFVPYWELPDRCTPVPVGGLDITIYASEAGCPEGKGVGAVLTVPTTDCPDCTRLYFSNDTTGIPTVARDAAWDKGNAENGMSWYRGLLKPSPASSRDGSNSWQVGTIGVPIAFQHGQFLYELAGSGTLSGTVKAVMRAARNSGVGVSSSQEHQAQMVVRIVSADGSTVRGTLLAAHQPGAADSTIWTATTTSRKFPAGALWGAGGAAMSSVAYQDGDWIVVEYGSWTTVDGGGTGASIYQNDQAGAAGDLPEDEATTTNLRSWIDLCVPGGLL
jgi:hypothetical protein